MKRVETTTLNHDEDRAGKQSKGAKIVEAGTNPTITVQRPDRIVQSQIHLRSENASCNIWFAMRGGKRVSADQIGSIFGGE